MSRLREVSGGRLSILSPCLYVYRVVCAACELLLSGVQ